MSMRIVVFGGGVMGGTLAGGFSRREPRPAVTVVEKRPERAAELRDQLGVEVVDPAIDDEAGKSAAVGHREAPMAGTGVRFSQRGRVA